MATILTIHGTNASGPAQGSDWWQQSSQFEAELRRLVESRDGRLDFVPLIWDGANSEQSRQRAGATLLKKVAGLEKKGESYCIVGHSHGGSIIAAGLIYSAHRIEPLNHLSRWITVGTPFITSRPKRLMFSRLGVVSKAAYLAVLAWCIGIWAYLNKPALYVSQPLAEKILGAGAAAILFSLLPVLMVRFVLKLWDLDKRPWHQTDTRGYAARLYAARWQALWHHNDEAIRGLASVQAVTFPFFGRSFAVPAAALLAVLAIPIFAVGWVWIYEPDPALVAASQERADLRKRGYTNLEILRADAEKKGQLNPDGSLKGSPWVAGLGMLATLFGPPLAAAVVAIGILLLFRLMASPASSWLSHRLNRLTSAQVKRSALGGDLEGEVAVVADARPMWLEHGFPSLPAALSEEITRYSDAAAAKSIARLRAALGSPALVDPQRQQADMFHELLTWEELIHTAYFKVPRFQKLIAYSIGCSTGFSASPAFLSDPDYAVVKGWFEELQRAYGAAQIAVPSKAENEAPQR